MTRPPRILLVMPDQWPRALLRASLREAGYDAVGARSVRGAARQAAPAPERGPVALVVVDDDAAVEEAEALRALASSLGAPPMLLVAHAIREPPRGAWTRTVRRPVSVAELSDVVQALVPLPAAARVPLDAG